MSHAREPVARSAASTNSRSPAAPTSGAASPKITPEHRTRHAYVYIRQSTPKQVRENTESRLLQYRLTRRAAALGWPEERIHVIDSDLGRSGAEAESRTGFQTLVAEVSLGRAGIVLALKVSRLARNGKDWHQLLELCALFGTLLADAEGMYDPRHYNDRLLLGLKGTLSEAELHLIRQRMDAGRLEKARRGELVQHLPTGYVRAEDGSVHFDPDASVQAQIRLVFERFRALGTAEKVVRFFNRNGLLLPRHQTAGEFAGETLWKPATAAAVLDILRNPAYAGAFVYGRRPADPRRRAIGLAGRARRLAPEEWQVLIRDHHPAYVSWDEWERNQETLRRNAQRYDERCAPGVPREGRSILAGLLRCGQCGMQLRVSYKQRHRYKCDGLTRHYGGKQCFSVPGPLVDSAVRDAVFEALSAEQIDLLDRMVEEKRTADAAVDAEWERRLERTRYAVRLAERRYRAVDPENRIVAATLECEWNGALAELEGAESAYDAYRTRQAKERTAAWSDDLKAKLRHLEETLPDFWPELTNAQRAKIVRTLVSHVIVWRPRPQQVRLRIVWLSGHYSDRTAVPGIRYFREMDGYEHLIEQIRRWVEEEHLLDREIAARLRAQGIQSPRRRPFDAVMVGKLRRRLGIVHPLHRIRRQERFEGKWTVHGLAARYGVNRNRLYRLFARGGVEPDRHPISGNYLIPDDPDVLRTIERHLGYAKPDSRDTTTDSG